MATVEYRVQAVDDYGTTEGVPVEAAVEAAINANAQDGWEFMRIDTVSSGSPQKIWGERKSVMIFKRQCEVEAEAAVEDKPLVLTKPIFMDRSNGTEMEIPTESSHRPTIEAAVNGARGGFSNTPSLPSAEKLRVLRSTGTRHAYSSGQTNGA